MFNQLLIGLVLSGKWNFPLHQQIWVDPMLLSLGMHLVWLYRLARAKNQIRERGRPDPKLENVTTLLSHVPNVGKGTSPGSGVVGVRFRFWPVICFPMDMAASSHGPSLLLAGFWQMETTMKDAWLQQIKVFFFFFNVTVYKLFLLVKWYFSNCRLMYYFIFYIRIENSVSSKKFYSWRQRDYYPKQAAFKGMVDACPREDRESKFITLFA